MTLRIFCATISLLALSHVTSSLSTETGLPDENEIFDAILSNTKYDLRMRPTPDGEKEPVKVCTSVYMYFLGHIDDARLEFDTTMMIRQRWFDPRLVFANANLSNIDKVESLQGESWFTERIWTPNVFIENEQGTSTLTKLLRENQLVRIQSDGLVQFNYRVTTTLFCNMDLHRFPHDKQLCTVRLESWTLTARDLLLQWEPIEPLQIFEFIRPEYTILGHTTTETTSCYSDTFPTPTLKGRKVGGSCEEAVGVGTKNYSTIYVNISLQRKIGHYLLDYYIPSMLLVAMSWVSFWLHPSAVPGRTTLGTSTWLTFITLTHNTATNQLPKVSYIKFLDVWFLLCTLFIFASLLEFALVNSISRKTLGKSSKKKARKNASNLTVVTTVAVKDNDKFRSDEEDDKHKDLADIERQTPKRRGLKSMSGEELAIWMDRKARILFPFFFVVFNIAYWSFAFRADCGILYNCDAL